MVDGLALLQAHALNNQARHVAAERFAELHRAAHLRRLWNWLSGQTANLADLNEELQNMQLVGSHQVGLLAVPLAQIRGSEGRSMDFDLEFRPLKRNACARWVSILLARGSGVHLPPVELIRIGDRDYVRDGHHRISVARWVGQHAIEARVTIWELAPAARR